MIPRASATCLRPCRRGKQVCQPPGVEITAQGGKAGKGKLRAKEGQVPRMWRERGRRAEWGRTPESKRRPLRRHLRGIPCPGWRHRGQRHGEGSQLASHPLARKLLCPGLRVAGGVGCRGMSGVGHGCPVGFAGPLLPAPFTAASVSFLRRGRGCTNSARL